MFKIKDYTIPAILFVFFIAVIVNLPGCYNTGTNNEISKPAFVHHCEWLGCKNEGSEVFHSEYEEGTDGYYFDLNHFTHPEWSEDQCDEMIFTRHQLRDYQISVTLDSIIIFDGDRKLAGMPFENSKLDSIILNDNQ